MSSEWKSLSIGDLVNSGEAIIQTGPFGSQLHKCDYVDDGVSVIPTEAIGRGRILEIKVPKISPNKASELARHRLETGDILFARRGAQATGLSAVVDHRYEGALCGTGALLLRTNSKRVLPHYLSLYLSSDFAFNWLRTHAVGAVMPNLNTGIIKALPLKLPSISEQRELSIFLGSIDDRIALLRETNATLEAIAQALFKSWFVDFDPVHAKQQGRAPEGLDEATAALFPDSFEESELGLVPRGWGQTSVGQLCSLTKGCSYKGDGLSEDQGAYMFNLGCFNAPRVFATEKVKRYTGEYKDRHMVSAGDLILANTDMTQERAILGRPLLIPDGYSPGFISHHVFKATPKDDGDSVSLRLFLFFSFLQPAFRERAVGYATGTTVLAIPKDALENHQLIFPPETIGEVFSQTMKPMIDQIAQNIELSNTLATLRDTLLPRLISGQLRLPEAEEMIEEIA